MPGGEPAGSAYLGTQCVVSLSRVSLRQLVFLAFNLIGLCLHLSGMAETGVRSYWHSPGRWLEVGSPVVVLEKNGTRKPVSLPESEDDFSRKRVVL